MQALGIDIGGSGIKGAPVETETGQLLAERLRIKTPRGAKPEPVAAVVAEIANHFNWKGPVGIGLPGPLPGGVVKMAANISEKWIGLNAAEVFTQATKRPCVVINDADAAGLAEIAFGAGKNQPGIVIMVTLGTGIGSAIFLNGHLVPNTEFGHIEIKGREAESKASDAARERENLSWKKYARRLNRYLHSMEKLFWPTLFIVGGGISKDFEEYGPLLDVDAKVVPAQFLNEAGIVGAALATQGLVIPRRKK